MVVCPTYWMTFKLSIPNAIEFGRKKATVNRVRKVCFDFSCCLSPGSRLNRSLMNFSGRFFWLFIRSCQLPSFLELRLCKNSTDGMEVATLSPAPSPSHLVRLDLSSSSTCHSRSGLGNHRHNPCQLTHNREVDITVESQIPSSQISMDQLGPSMRDQKWKILKNPPKDVPLSPLSQNSQPPEY